MPVTFVFTLIGGFSISAFPLFSGFVSKSMIVSSAGETHRMGIFLALTLASAGTFLHTGLKLPYYMFFGKDSGLRAHEPPRNMLIGMGLAAAACIIIGVYPSVLYKQPAVSGRLPRRTRPGTSPTRSGMLGFTALGFFLLLRQLDPHPSVSLDTDWFYRKGVAVLWPPVSRALAGVEGVVGQIYDTVVMRRLALAVAGIYVRLIRASWTPAWSASASSRRNRAASFEKP